MALSQFASQGDQFGVSSETKSSYSSAFTLPIEADTYGKPIPISRGTRPIVGQLLWSTSVLQETKTTTTTYETTYSPFDAYEVHSGEIVPPPPPDPVTTIETTKMLVDCAIGFGAPLNSEVTPRIIQIRAGSTIVYDASGDTTVQLQSMEMKLYNGSEEQLPDPLMESYLGSGNVPAYRGEIYVVFKQLDLLPFGGVFPEITCILSDDSSGTLAPIDLDGDVVLGRTLVPDWTRNLLYVRDSATAAIEIYDAKRFLQLATLPVITGLAGSTSNFDACYWLNFIITMANGETAVIHAATGQVLDTDDYLNDTMFHISQIVDMGAEASIVYVLCGSFFGPVVLFEVQDDGTLIRAGRNDDFDPMEAACRGAVTSGVSYLYTGEGSRIYQYKLDSTLRSREPDGFGNYTIPYVSPIASQLYWIDLNDFDVAPGETIVNIGSMNYFPNDNSLIVYARTSGADGCVIKVSAEGKVLWASIIVNGPPDLSNWPGNHSRMVGGQLGIQGSSGTYYNVDCYTGTITDLGVSSPATPSDNSLWDGETASFIIELTSDDELKRVTGAVTPGGRIPLSTILEELSIFAGLDPNDIIIDPQITNLVDGFCLDNGIDTDYWSLVRTWGTAFLFAVYESGQGIEFRSIVEVAETPEFDFELTIDDLATKNPTDFPVNVEGDPFANAAILSTRAPDQDLVDYVKMTYKDIGYDFGENTVYRQRARVPGDEFIRGKELTIAIPELIMLTDEAASLVSNILFNEIAKRTTHEWRLPGTYGHTLPGDKFSITVGNFNYKIKVTTLTYHYDHSLSLIGRDYYSDVSLIVSSGQTPQSPPLTPVQDSRSQIIIFDTPLLFISDELGNDIISIYYGVAGFGQDGWQMANVYRSETGGYYEQIDIVDRELIIGRCLSVLGPIGDYSTIDRYNEFELLLENGNPDAFHTVSDSSWFSGGFLAVIGAPGRWEVVSIQNFEDLGDGRFMCSGLIRGLRDTYMNTDNHAAGDRVIFPRANRARRLLREAVAGFGEVRLYKAAGGDQSVLNAPRESVTLNAEVQRPMSVVGYKAVKDSGDDDVTISWVRQSRLTPEFVDSGPEPVFNEFSEVQFQLDIYDGPGGAIIRTETINAASSYLYSAANQTGDGLTPPLDRITVKVTQEDDTLVFVGRSVERTIIVER